MPDLVRISEAASLGLHTLVLLASQPERRFANHEIASALQVSSHHLAKVMTRLVKSGLAISEVGRQGGFQLPRPADEIKLLSIHEAVEGPLGPPECFLNESICSGTCCLLGDFLASVHDQIRELLAKTSLAELVEHAGLLKSTESLKGGAQAGAFGNPRTQRSPNPALK